MENEIKKKRWIEMAIREIWTQAHFAELAFLSIKGGTDSVFPAIHSFLSHCSNVSKMLRSEDNNETAIGDILSVNDTSTIHDRRLRDHLEHYYDRLKRWVDKYPVNVNVGTYNIGPKSALKISNFVFVTHYDPESGVFTFIDEDFNLRSYFEEVKSIKELANNWVSAHARIGLGSED